MRTHAITDSPHDHLIFVSAFSHSLSLIKHIHLRTHTTWPCRWCRAVPSCCSILSVQKQRGPTGFRWGMRSFYSHWAPFFIYTSLLSTFLVLSSWSSHLIPFYHSPHYTDSQHSTNSLRDRSPPTCAAWHSLPASKMPKAMTPRSPPSCFASDKLRSSLLT